MDDRPRNLREMLAEAKDSSELMIDLAYAALYFGDPDMAEEVGYVRLPQVIYDRCQANVDNRRTGTQFLRDGEKVHGPLPEVYK